ncbi:MAG TPA: hypothetical protein VLZ72_08145 [Flavobacterium sp.]|nr:hypothetical protein [Flavobacterium sp.]
MKKLSLLYLLLLPTFVFGQEKDLDQKIDGFIQPIVDVLGSFIFFKPFEKIGFGMPLVVVQFDFLAAVVQFSAPWP